MPRFFFDIDDGDMLLRDDEGSEFRDLQTARRDAARALGEIAADLLPKSGPERQMSITVRDHEGQLLRKLSMRYDEEPL